jgi:hypothetical protein
LAPAFAAEPADSTEIAADTLEIESAGGDSEPSSLSDVAPASEFGTGGGLESTSEDEVVTERGRTQSFDSADADDSASIDEEIVTSGGVGAEAGDGIADGAVSGFALGAGDGALAGAGAGAAEGAGSGAGKGISLPLWQLQIALAALAVAAIGAWAGLRRVRGE